MNGDGRADVVGFGHAGVYISTSTGTSFRAPRLRNNKFGYIDGWRTERHVRTVGDVIGNGNDDIVGFADDGVYVKN